MRRRNSYGYYSSACLVSQRDSFATYKGYLRDSTLDLSNGEGEAAIDHDERAGDEV